MEETPIRQVDAIIDAIDEAVREENLGRAAIQLEYLRRELEVERAMANRPDCPPGRLAIH